MLQYEKAQGVFRHAELSLKILIKRVELKSTEQNGQLIVAVRVRWHEECNLYLWSPKIMYLISRRLEQKSHLAVVQKIEPILYVPEF